MQVQDVIMETYQDFKIRDFGGGRNSHLNESIAKQLSFSFLQLNSPTPSDGHLWLEHYSWLESDARKGTSLPVEIPVYWVTIARKCGRVATGWVGREASGEQVAHRGTAL